MARQRPGSPLGKTIEQFYREGWRSVKLDPPRPVQLLLADGTWCQSAYLHTWRRDPQGNWIGMVESYGHPDSGCGQLQVIPADRLRPRDED